MNDFTHGSTQIYSVNDDTVPTGPFLSVVVDDAAVVQFGDSFILLGGFDYTIFGDSSGNKLIN